MQQLIDMVHQLAGPCTDEQRTELIMKFYYVARGSAHALAGVMDNEPATSDVYMAARDNLQALRGAIDEMLRKHGVND